jgi:hypothetical protein
MAITVKPGPEVTASANQIAGVAMGIGDDVRTTTEVIRAELAVIREMVGIIGIGLVLIVGIGVAAFLAQQDTAP